MTSMSQASASSCASTSTSRPKTAASPTRRASSASPQTIEGDRRQGRQGHPARAFRPPEGRSGRGEFAAAGRRGGRRGHRPAGELRRRLHRQNGRRRHRHDAERRHSAAREHPLLQGRGEERSGACRRARQARRHLCQRRLLRRPPRPCHHRGARPQAAGPRGTGDAEGARGADARAWQSGPAGRGDRRRGQGVDEARAPRQPRQQGRHSHHRRRHGQHLPVRRRQGDRQVPVREGSRRHRAVDRVGGGKGQMPHPAAGRRDGGQRTQGSRATRMSSMSIMSARTR